MVAGGDSGFVFFIKPLLWKVRWHTVSLMFSWSVLSVDSWKAADLPRKKETCGHVCAPDVSTGGRYGGGWHHWCLAFCSGAIFLCLPKAWWQRGRNERRPVGKDGSRTYPSLEESPALLAQCGVPMPISQCSRHLPGPILFPLSFQPVPINPQILSHWGWNNWSCLKILQVGRRGGWRGYVLGHKSTCEAGGRISEGSQELGGQPFTPALYTAGCQNPPLRELQDISKERSLVISVYRAGEEPGYQKVE